jgi:two-component system OmpR family response regulator
MKGKILIVDDDPHIREVLRFALEQAHYKVSEAADGRKALGLFQAQGADLLVVDVMMPEMDGLELCRELRKSSPVPILFLSSKADEIDRVLGLEIGGDDYLTKPFSPRELLARVQVILRRTRAQDSHGQAPEGPALYQQGKVSLDVESHQASFQGKPVELTATEFSILQTLLNRPTKVHTREQLMGGAYAQQTVVSDRTIDSHVRGVREKFAQQGCKSIIETVHGVGYRLGGGR